MSSTRSSVFPTTLIGSTVGPVAPCSGETTCCDVDISVKGQFDGGDGFEFATGRGMRRGIDVGEDDTTWANGIGEFAVNTGRSPLVGRAAGGVELLGGSQTSGSCFDSLVVGGRVGA